MEWIQNDGETAPRPAQTRPDPSLLASYFAQLRDFMTTLAKQGLVHGDLSPYNDLVAGERLVAIGVAQQLFGVVDAPEHLGRTNVLWPSLQRDFLLSMAAEGLCRPLWSEAILEELHEHEALKLVSRGAAHADALARTEQLIGRMRGAFDDAIVTGWEPLDAAFSLPDPDDEHVVAAALVGGAGVIVTDNLRHYPAEQLPGHLRQRRGRLG